MSLFDFVLLQHFPLACVAAGLFVLGGILSFPALKWGPAFFKRFPLLLFRMIRVLMGPRPGLMRTGLVIFCFNGTAMFVYMASGVRAELPGIITLLTGFNITAILLLVAEGADGAGPEPYGGSSWVPGRVLTAVCGLAVLFIELPCFWYTIALGMSLGQEVSSGHEIYAQALPVRANAYVRLVLPALFISAACEVVAIRGMAAAESNDRTTEETNDVFHLN